MDQQATADELRDCRAELFGSRAPCPHPPEKGGLYQDLPIPTFLIELGQEAAADLGPRVLTYLERAAAAAFDAALARMHRPAATPAPT